MLGYKGLGLAVFFGVASKVKNLHNNGFDCKEMFFVELHKHIRQTVAVNIGNCASQQKIRTDIQCFRHSYNAFGSNVFRPGFNAGEKLLRKARTLGSLFLS